MLQQILRISIHYGRMFQMNYHSRFYYRVLGRSGREFFTLDVLECLYWIILLKDQNRINRIVLVCTVGVVLLCSMFLGIYLGDYRLGNNLCIAEGQMIDAPIFRIPNMSPNNREKG